MARALAAGGARTQACPDRSRIDTGESWTVVRLAGSGTEVWREVCYYGSWPRAAAVSRLLNARYGRLFAGLFRTKRSVTYLLGDGFRGADPREASLGETPWVAESDGEPSDS